MKELFSLKSFHQVLMYLLMFGIIFGTGIAMYINNSTNFKFSNFVLLFIVPLSLVFRGLFKNSNIFIKDFKAIISDSKAV